MADQDSLKSGEIGLGFIVRGYPGTGRRTETEVDLASCDRIELVQGAFMGDVAVTVGQVDFSTTFGWVTLIGWLLGLSAALRGLVKSGSHVLYFGESDDFVSFMRYEDMIFVATSYRPGIGCAEYCRFDALVRGFIGSQLEWIAVNYPATMKNPVMTEIISHMQQIQN